jgi:hypothetical protein
MLLLVHLMCSLLHRFMCSISYVLHFFLERIHAVSILCACMCNDLRKFCCEFEMCLAPDLNNEDMNKTGEKLAKEFMDLKAPLHNSTFVEYTTAYKYEIEIKQKVKTCFPAREMYNGCIPIYFLHYLSITLF